MTINISEVIWTIVCFFALLFVLKNFLFTPLITFMDDRKARIEAGFAEGREAEQKKEENAAALQQSWQQRNDEAKQLLADGKGADEKKHICAVTAAKADAAAAIKEARTHIEEESAAAREEVAENMSELVAALTHQLLDVSSNAHAVNAGE